MASEKGVPSLIENTEVIKEHSKRKVAYYYDSVIGNFYYGQGHVMKPNRIRMTDHLLLSYGLWKQMYVFRPVAATYEQLSKFHKEDYVRFLKAITPDNCKSFQKEMLMFNVGEDCPLFENLFEFCQISCGGSIAAARKLMMKQTDISINWMGGLHHAKKNEASGFCYANDIVLAILELLKMHQRVLYVDIDVHHGDGVEEAFYTTNRVMTVSFHKYGDFFPGTGNVTDRGVGQGRLYTVNVPFRAGIDDDVFQSIFVPVMTKVMDKFDPGVVVLQCGADSLAGDRLGAFNLTIKGHGACVSFFRKYNVPLLILGGGGYTPRNVARCWTYETALALGREIPDDLPYNDYYEYYCPSYKLFWQKDDATNDNTETYLRRILNYVTDNLSLIEIAPSVQMHAPLESKYTFLDDTTISVDLADPEERLPTAVTDTMVEDPGEYYDGETESGEKNDHDAKVEKEASESTSVGPSSQ